MRTYGFSTGAVALGDFTTALKNLSTVRTDAIELSALRPYELVPLIDFVETADLERYSYISVHAPTGYAPPEERHITLQLGVFAERGWPIVVHPDAICNVQHWRPLGHLLYVENMDRRKPVGRSAIELRKVFAELPKSGLCFDIAHARQFDPSMTEAFKILQEHGDRVRQVHISEVNTSSRHDRLSPTAVRAYRAIASLIPTSAPVILETPAQGAQMQEQLALAADALEVQPGVQSTARIM